MTETTKATLRLIAASVKSELDAMKAITDAKEGSRELSLAVTNIEQGLLWLGKASE